MRNAMKRQAPARRGSRRDPIIPRARALRAVRHLSTILAPASRCTCGARIPSPVHLSCPSCGACLFAGGAM